MKISEFGRTPGEFAKRPRELHTVKQKLSHGSEINVAAKSPEKRKRKNISDMLKFAVAGVAAAAVVTVSAPTTAQETKQLLPPVLPAYEENHKYQYTVSFPTYREALEPGGYAVCLDLSTEEKKQALYKYFADSIYEFLRFDDEKGEEYNNDPDPKKALWTYFPSETEDGYVGAFGRSISGTSDGYSWESVLPSGIVLKYRNSDTQMIGEHGDSHSVGTYPAFYYELTSVLGMENLPGARALYKNKTRDEILETIAEPLENYFFEIQRAQDGTQWTNLRYEAMHTLEQFTITQGKADIIMPVFFKTVRDDELYGYKTVTASANTDYILVTGSDEYPLDKPYGYRFDPRCLEKIVRSRYVDEYFTYDWASGLMQIDYPSEYHAHKNVTCHVSYGYEITLADFIHEQSFDEPQDGAAAETAHIYYSPVALSVGEDTELTLPQLSRLLPIEDKYYLYRLGYSSKYTITNNGDHEVVVIGNLCSWDDEGLNFDNINSSMTRDDSALGQFFNCEPLLPGESVTIFVSSIFAGDKEMATLTMPECCTVVDSSGQAYSHTEFEVDLINGKVKEG